MPPQATPALWTRRIPRKSRSGWSREHAAAEIDACGYLGKPFSVDQLLGVIGDRVAKEDVAPPGVLEADPAYAR